MQPSDTTSAQTPPPAGGSQPPKQSFWSKLFGKKPAPVIPPHESLAPQPQLNDTTPESPAPAAELQTAAPETDSIIGTPDASDLSAPDQNGEVTSLPIDVPSSIESPVEGDTAPTVQTLDTAPQPFQQSVTEQPIEPPVVTPVPAAEPTPPVGTDLPPVEPSPSSQPPQPPQQ